MSGRRPRRELVAPFLLGAASLLALEIAVAVVVAEPRTETVAGSARAATAAVAPAQAAAAAPAAPPPAPGTATTPKPQSPARQDAGQRPNSIRLPAGGSATLVRKEVQGPNAVLPVPDDLGEATWWGAGLAASNGASVFAGHVNWHGRVGPFAELWATRIGEQVTVQDAKGKTFTYRVAQTLTLGKDELPSRADALFSQQGKHRIVLVTCGGRWLGGSTGYAENRVVIAEPID
ncbi:class F sortase [Amycolatopsis suaedae]|uniref:Class F sortase n=1 Tax=Amycolatopsis suaedae TaxID=2510978 RepID=A0A4Q7JAK7_9PSEU|nr:class F sortase [Amycolatopsis suaedae]RZQ63523.1 class F sortase [Amycolatopsis suaedae]